AELEYEPDPGEEYRAREGGAEPAAPDGVSVPAPREEAAWAARHCAAEIQGCDFRSWLLLASPPGVQELHDADE
ncbi:MAG TPA: hypothetical protein VN776_14805, partial [Terracidiphilus sp.]|nr:hypothetical protein [Terracidiphilus sp.]